MAKAKTTAKTAASSSAPTAAEPKTPEQVREEAEAKSAAAAEARDALAVAQQSFRLAADLVQAFGDARLDREAFEEAFDKACSEGQDAVEKALAAVPVEEP